MAIESVGVGVGAYTDMLVTDWNLHDGWRDPAVGISAKFHIFTLRHSMLLILQKPKICFTEEILI